MSSTRNVNAGSEHRPMLPDTLSSPTDRSYLETSSSREYGSRPQSLSDGWWKDAAAWVVGPARSPSAASPNYESMEYNPANSAVYREWLQWQPHNRVWDKWLVMAMIGVSVGTTSFLLQKTIQFLFDMREVLGRFFIDRQAIWGYVFAWLSYVLLSAIAALVSAMLVVKVAPAASASGVPHIMAFLNGVRIPKVLNVWTFCVKFWSCSLAVAAGLPVGPEGPLIHMGAILGAAMSGLHSTTMGFDLGWFRHLRGSKHKRDFVTAGVAAGVAAAFDAPLGGLLFAFEEVASFWHSHLGWQVFFCCTMAVLVQNLLQSLDREIHNTGHFGFFNGNVTFKVGVEVYAHVLTIVPAALLGLVCGAFAVVFSKLNLTIMRWRARFIKLHDGRRLGEVLIMTLVYIGVCMLLPHFFQCRSTDCTVPVSDPTAEPTCPSALVHSNDTLITTNEDLALAPDPFTCAFVHNPSNPDEYLVKYNPMATLINPLGEDTISRLFARGVHREFGYTTLWVLLGWYFIGAAWAAGMEIASGMFVPMLLIGATLGRLMGLVMVDQFGTDEAAWWMPAADSQWKWIDPGVFAVVGAAGFMGGVTRLTIALAAIMMEVSSDVQMLLPVLVSILVAKSFADIVEPHSYYHAVMSAAQMPFLPPKPHTRVNLDLVTVRAVMAAPVVTVPRVVTVAEVHAMLRDTAHNGFPVVQPAADGLAVCIGIVTRNVLQTVLEAAIKAGTTRGLQVSYPELNKHIDDPLNLANSAAADEPDLERGSLLARDRSGSFRHVTIEVPGPLCDQPLDLGRFVNRSAFMIQEAFSLARAYALFTSMGARHLVVVDDRNQVRGIITRKDLADERLNSARSYVDGLA